MSGQRVSQLHDAKRLFRISMCCHCGSFIYLCIFRVILYILFFFLSVFISVFFFLVKRARLRWPLPVDRFVLSQSADASCDSRSPPSLYVISSEYIRRAGHRILSIYRPELLLNIFFIKDLCELLRGIMSNRLELECFGFGSGAASQGCQFLDSSRASFHIVPDWAEQ